MVSPANTYVGLTTNEPGSAPGEPQKYYPTGNRTYLRIVPTRLDPGGIGPARDEAGRLHEGRGRQRQGGIRPGPRDAARSSRRAATASTIVSNTGIDPTAPNFRSYASTIKGQGADCFFFAGIVSNGAVQITKDVHAALPTAKVFGGDGVCTDSYTSAKKGGVPASLVPAASVHGRDAEAERPTPAARTSSPPIPRRTHLEPGSLRDLRLRGDEARAGHDRQAGRPGQQQVGRALGAVRDHEPQLGARYLRVRQERRHDAEVIRPVQGRLVRRARLLQDDHAHEGALTVVGIGR